MPGFETPAFYFPGKQFISQSKDLYFHRQENKTDKQRIVFKSPTPQLHLPQFPSRSRQK